MIFRADLARAVLEGRKTVTRRDAWRAINGSYDPRVLVWRVEFEAVR